MPAADTTPAGWVVDQVRDFDYTVGAVVPACFEAYARVFHPARLMEPNRLVEVRWSQVADAYGRVMHPAAEWGSLTYAWKPEYPKRDGVWSEEPSTGSLPASAAAPLAAVLAKHTDTPERCWFAVWEGYGRLGLLTVAPRFDLPQRPMLLLAGSIESSTISSEQPWDPSANLWWPDDRAWCVGSEIDLMTTYIGGTAACIDAILATTALEALPVSVDQSITWEADQINPLPGRPGTGSA